jgi:hypothetical protein
MIALDGVYAVGKSGKAKFHRVKAPSQARHNLVRYHGVFARGCHQPNSTLRKLIIPKSTKRVRGKENSKPDKMSEFEDAVSRNELVAPLTWAQRRDGEPLKRVFERAAFGSLIQT